jgi:hypothetical protein
LYDTSFVDPTIHTYVLAASATAAAGNGPSSNPRIIVVDTLTNKVVQEYNAKPTFAGLCPPNTSGFVGPSGVILIEGSKRNQGKGNQGKDNQGQDNQGQDNQGKGNQGKGNQGKGKVNGKSGLQTVRSIPRVAPTPGTQTTSVAHLPRLAPSK